MKTKKISGGYITQHNKAAVVGSCYASSVHLALIMDELSKIDSIYDYHANVDRNKAFIAIYEKDLPVNSYHAEWDDLVNLLDSQAVERSIKTINSFKGPEHGRIRQTTHGNSIPHS